MSKAKDSFPVLLSSAGRRVALVRIFRDALSTLKIDGRVLAADMSPCAAAFHDADAGFQVPRCSSPEFVPAMLEICRREAIRLIVPTIDPELPVLAAARDEFSFAGTTVAISSPEVIAIANDKRRTHEWLAGNGFPTVRQAEVEEVLAHPGHWPFPLLVKPVAGSSSIGVATVSTAEELRMATRDGDFVVQTIASGHEYTIDGLVTRDGTCVSTVPRRRLEVRAGEVSKGMTVHSALLEDLATRLFEELPGAYGVLNAQVFLDEDTGETNVIEINPRFGGGFPLSWEAGACYPQWMIEELIGVSPARRSGWRDGLVMLRYDDAVFVDRPAAGL